VVYLFVGVGGAIGSLFRYFLSYLVIPTWNSFPLGTVVVNLFGAFILGWLASKFLTFSLHPDLKTGITSGIIGSFTTFSTLSVDAMSLFLDARWGYLFLYLFISAFGGLGLTAIGYFLGQGTSGEVEMK
jgi:fluoride exporter